MANKLCTFHYYSDTYKIQLFWYEIALLTIVTPLLPHSFMKWDRKNRALLTQKQILFWVAHHIPSFPKSSSCPGLYWSLTAKVRGHSSETPGTENNVYTGTLSREPPVPYIFAWPQTARPISRRTFNHGFENRVPFLRSTPGARYLFIMYDQLFYDRFAILLRAFNRL